MRCESGEVCVVCESWYEVSKDGSCVLVKEEEESYSLMPTRDTVSGIICLVFVIGLCVYGVKRSFNSSVESQKKFIEFQQMIYEQEQRKRDSLKEVEGSPRHVELDEETSNSFQTE